MAEREVGVQLDRPAAWLVAAGTSPPSGCLGENILRVGVLAVELGRTQADFFASLTSGAKLDRAVVPLGDQRAGEPEVGLRELRVQRDRGLEQDRRPPRRRFPSAC